MPCACDPGTQRQCRRTSRNSQLAPLLRTSLLEDPLSVVLHENPDGVNRGQPSRFVSSPSGFSQARATFTRNCLAVSFLVCLSTELSVFCTEAGHKTQIHRFIVSRSLPATNAKR